jgi:hypothetical protein
MAEVSGMNAYSQWTIQPIKDLVGRRLLKRSATSLEQAAAKIWEIAPADESYNRPAYFLPGQIERIKGWAFTDEHPRRNLEGNVHWVHTATRAFLLKDAILVDGGLYANGFCERFRRRSARGILGRIETEIDRGAFYCSPEGVTWFGNWLMSDCLTYPLTSGIGQPLTIKQPLGQHTLDYERLHGMQPTRLESAIIREAIVFHDVGQNAGKRARSTKRREMLLAGRAVKPHPGVFIVRGASGVRRLLLNEMEIAERLRDRRGFKIVDPQKMTVDEIITECAGADTVVAMESSGMMHGIALQEPGTRMLTLQPSNRFAMPFKDVADRDGLHFGFVVGYTETLDFSVDPDEIERTLDLFPPVARRG